MKSLVSISLFVSTILLVTACSGIPYWKTPFGITRQELKDIGGEPFYTCRYKEFVIDYYGRYGGGDGTRKFTPEEDPELFPNRVNDPSDIPTCYGAMVYIFDARLELVASSVIGTVRFSSKYRNYETAEPSKLPESFWREASESTDGQQPISPNSAQEKEESGDVAIVE